MNWKPGVYVLIAGLVSACAVAEKHATDSSLEIADSPTSAISEQTGQASLSAQIEGRRADEEALLAHVNKPWSGDLGGMFERGFIRVLTAHNPLFFHFDGAEKRGLTYEAFVAFERDLNKSRTKNQPPIRILMIPVPRDRLLSSLNNGLGDIAAANLTITPGRQKQVQFSDPFYRNVTELVVTHVDGLEIKSLDDLVKVGVNIRKSSSYYEHLSALNRERELLGKKAIPIRLMDERMEDYDLIEMVNAGMLPAIIVDNHIARLWAKFFDKVVVHEDIIINIGGSIAWAMRKDSPQLLEAVNRFVKKARIGTLLGNVIANRYFKNTKWVKRALSEDGMARRQDTIRLIKKYASRYDFDWLMVFAQAYQESKLDQSKRSRAGAVGVMQVMRKTALDPRVGIPDIHLTGDNIHAGVKYLRHLRERYFGDRAVQRSLLRVIAEQPVEPADGISIAGVGHVGDVVRAHDVGGETADASEDAGVLADATGIFAHGDIARIVVPVFDSPVCPDGGTGGVGGEGGVRHVVGGFAGHVPQAGGGVAYEAAALDPDDRGDEGRPFGVVEMAARVEHLDVARLVTRPRGVGGLMAVERLVLVA